MTAHSDRTKPIICWFREDLRIADNAALSAAVESGHPLICLYIRDEDTTGLRPLGGASRWWLHHSLTALSKSLHERGLTLILRRGKASDILIDLARQTGAHAIHWNRRYSASEIAADTDTKSALREAGIAVQSHAGNLLVEPWSVKTGSGGPFRVFTPFWKACLAQGWRSDLHTIPGKVDCAGTELKGDNLDDWGLLPRNPDWARGFAAHWQPGEAGARARLADFLDEGLNGYATLRDRPDRPNTSRLSPHLRFGEISPNTIALATRQARDSERIGERDAGKFLSEIGWREFSYHLLYHFPDLPRVNLQSRFDRFPWRDDARGLRAWQRGMTGYPIVDAGMRELWQTGTMHNRVRMVVASFLIKDLLVHWHEGEAWFWDTLLDADHANNAASWQWVAGSGADAAPFFRVFNPMLQGEKHDPGGAYVRRFVPELADMPDKFIHRPWEAPEPVLQAAGVTLGTTYPERIVDHAMARQRALAAFQSIKSDADADAPTSAQDAA